MRFITLLPILYANKCNVPDKDKLNVHFVAHTHDDAGWLETVDSYYNSKVHYIMNTVIQSLEFNPERKFIFVEMTFLERYMRN